MASRNCYAVMDDGEHIPIGRGVATSLLNNPEVRAALLGESQPAPQAQGPLSPPSVSPRGSPPLTTISTPSQPTTPASPPPSGPTVPARPSWWKRTGDDSATVGSSKAAIEQLTNNHHLTGPHQVAPAIERARNIYEARDRYKRVQQASIPSAARIDSETRVNDILEKYNIPESDRAQLKDDAELAARHYDLDPATNQPVVATRKKAGEFRSESDFVSYFVNELGINLRKTAPDTYEGPQGETYTMRPINRRGLTIEILEDPSNKPFVQDLGRRLQNEPALRELFEGFDEARRVTLAQNPNIQRQEGYIPESAAPSRQPRSGLAARVSPEEMHKAGFGYLHNQRQGDITESWRRVEENIRSHKARKEFQTTVVENIGTAVMEAPRPSLKIEKRSDVEITSGPYRGKTGIVTVMRSRIGQASVALNFSGKTVKIALTDLKLREMPEFPEVNVQEALKTVPEGYELVGTTRDPQGGIIPETIESKFIIPKRSMTTTSTGPITLSRIRALGGDLIPVSTPVPNGYEVVGRPLKALYAVPRGTMETLSEIAPGLSERTVSPGAEAYEKAMRLVGRGFIARPATAVRDFTSTALKAVPSAVKRVLRNANDEWRNHRETGAPISIEHIVEPLQSATEVIKLYKVAPSIVRGVAQGRLSSREQAHLYDIFAEQTRQTLDVSGGTLKKLDEISDAIMNAVRIPFDVAGKMVLYEGTAWEQARVTGRELKAPDLATFANKYAKVMHTFDLLEARKNGGVDIDGVHVPLKRMERDFQLASQEVGENSFTSRDLAGVWKSFAENRYVKWVFMYAPFRAEFWKWIADQSPLRLVIPRRLEMSSELIRESMKNGDKGKLWTPRSWDNIVRSPHGAATEIIRSFPAIGFAFGVSKAVAQVADWVGWDTKVDVLPTTKEEDEKARALGSGAPSFQFTDRKTGERRDYSLRSFNDVAQVLIGWKLTAEAWRSLTESDTEQKARLGGEERKGWFDLISGAVFDSLGENLSMNPVAQGLAVGILSQFTKDPMLADKLVANYAQSVGQVIPGMKEARVLIDPEARDIKDRGTGRVSLTKALKDVTPGASLTLDRRVYPSGEVEKSGRVPQVIGFGMRVIPKESVDLVNAGGARRLSAALPSDPRDLREKYNSFVENIDRRYAAAIRSGTPRAVNISDEEGALYDALTDGGLEYLKDDKNLGVFRERVETLRHTEQQPERIQLLKPFLYTKNWDELSEKLYQLEKDYQPIPRQLWYDVERLRPASLTDLGGKDKWLQNKLTDAISASLSPRLNKKIEATVLRELVGQWKSTTPPTNGRLE